MNECPNSPDGKHQWVDITIEDVMKCLKNFDNNRVGKVCALVDHLQLHTNFDKNTTADLAHIVFLGMHKLYNE